MSTPIYDGTEPKYKPGQNTDEQGETAQQYSFRAMEENTHEDKNNRLKVDVDLEPDERPQPSPSQDREKASRLEDDLAMLQAERMASNTDLPGRDKSLSIKPSRSHRTDPVDEFDTATNPIHEHASLYKPPENPTNSVARFFKKVHESSFLVRYFTYIIPLVLVILIPLLLGAFVFKDATVGGVSMLWFCVWLEIVWLTLWAGRILAKFIQYPVAIIASLFTNNAKKWRDLASQLELPAALFFWWLSVEISFLPTMITHHADGNRGVKDWEKIVNKIIISIFVGVTLNLIEKLIIQLIAISFHLRTYADRIEINKFQIGSLTKLYTFSRENTSMNDSDLEEASDKPRSSGTRTPMMYADRAQKVARGALSKVGDVAGAVAGDFTGKRVNSSSHPHQVVLTLLRSTAGSQVLARRIYRTFVKDGFDTVFAGDLKSAFDNNEEADAAFAMFDKDMNGDISMEELEAVCTETGKERKSITASLKDLDSVVSKLDDVFFFIVVVITILVFLSLISASTAGVLTSAGSTLLALSWLFSATAQEFLQSIIFVFVKHPFDVGDRVSIYGNTGSNLTGDDYFVKEIALLYTEFKKMQGHVVQAPNSYLNTLFILNQRRSGGLAEAVPVIIKFGTTLEQIDALRQRLLDFVTSEKREFQTQILTELKEVTENYSITLNVVFFYKSNWQNELLRLQRRNKFICNLMICLQELQIEGPRMNLVGYRSDLPAHIAHQGSPPQYTATPGANTPGAMTDMSQTSEARDALGDLAPSSAVQIHHTQSILRNRNRSGTAASTRSQGGPSKRVDFSLGMKDLSSDDMISDVFWDRGRRIEDIVRSTNIEAAERRQQEKDQGRLDVSMDGASSHPRASNDSRQPSNFAQSRGSISPSVNRNRFFGRMGSRRSTPSRSRTRDGGGQYEDLMEQGRYQATVTDDEPGPGRPLDPRSGSVSTQGIYDDAQVQGTMWSSGVERQTTYDSERSLEDGYELRNYQRQ
ncbi:mechanosensitive ion channel family protein [Arthroderma uncinatum]|uniref:mechanosensitive ion channel family protein n=1 Tax=Arthroderma uncinatum TaxID=74035 RepID=UPI00144A7BD8|nr:mechanosensitive ion channel family protein [Arthroderma uncinatum]KAF3481859.1 mechanosensitive ion channel family protein [Arthroderma uncinatum]